MDQTLIDKIVGIRAMIDGATTPGEAEAATAAFQRLLMRHNLDAAEAAKLVGKNVEPQIHWAYVRLAEDGKPGLTWKVALMQTLCRYNFCDCIRDGFHGARVIVIGTESNIAAVSHLFKLMVPTFIRLSLFGFAEAMDEVNKIYKLVDKSDPESISLFKALKPNKTSWTNSFLLGVPCGLGIKMANERKHEESTMAGASDLVLVNNAAVEKFSAEAFPNIVMTKSDQPSDGRGYVQGVKAGHDYSSETPLRGESYRAVGGG